MFINPVIKTLEAVILICGDDSVTLAQALEAMQEVRFRLDPKAAARELVDEVLAADPREDPDGDFQLAREPKSYLTDEQFAAKHRPTARPDIEALRQKLAKPAPKKRGRPAKKKAGK